MLYRWRSVAVEQGVNQGGDVVDVDLTVAVAVAVWDSGGSAAQQGVDQGGDVVDVDLTVAVHVSNQLEADDHVLGRHGEDPCVRTLVSKFAATDPQFSVSFQCSVP